MLLAKKKQPEKGRLQEEGKDPFHSQSLADDFSRVFRELCPIRAELKFERNPGHDAHCEVKTEDAGPEARHLAIALIPGMKSGDLEEDDEQGQPHRQLRK
jgi:hypothetical protein